MRKFVFTVCLLFMASLYTDAIAQVAGEDIGEDIGLHVGIIDPTKPDNPIRRSPVRIPSVSIDDHTLFFNTPCDGCMLRLFNEDGDMVINMIIPDDSSIINLPTFLAGEYEIQILRGNYCFYGYINL